MKTKLQIYITEDLAELLRKRVYEKKSNRSRLVQLALEHFLNYGK